MSAEHKFFNNFGYKHQKPIIYMNEEIQHNLFIMEIYNNWDIIKGLMTAHKEGTIANRKLDGLDQMWVNTLVQNNIDILSFENADDFYETYIK